MNYYIDFLEIFIVGFALANKLSIVFIVFNTVLSYINLCDCYPSKLATALFLVYALSITLNLLSACITDGVI